VPQALIALDSRTTIDDRQRLGAVLELLGLKQQVQDSDKIWVNLRGSSEVHLLYWAIRQASIPATVLGKGFALDDRGSIDSMPRGVEVLTTFVLTKELTDADRFNLQKLLAVFRIQLANLDRTKVQLFFPKDSALELLRVMESAGLPLELAIG
jgi:hypothetical protein